MVEKTYDEVFREAIRLSDEEVNDRGGAAEYGAAEVIRERQKKRDEWLATLSPEERERIARIDSLNKRGRSLGLDIGIPYDAPDSMLAEVEQRIIAKEVGNSMPLDTHDRNRAIQKVLSRTALEFSPLARLKSVFSEREKAIAAANEVVARAEAELQKAADLQQKFDSLKARHTSAREELRRAREIHELNLAELARLDQDEELVARFLRVSLPPNNTGIPRIQSDAIDGGRLVIAAAVADWNRVEKVLLARVEKFEGEIAKLEKEFE